MNETYVTIRGRLTADPSSRTTRAGQPMTKFRLAHSARRPVPGQPGQWEDTETSYYDVLAYRSLAANIAVSLRRGHPVTVHGKQRIVSWQREDGTTWYGVEIDADAVGHDLTYGTTAFAKGGMGRPADSWTPGSGAQQGGDRPDPADGGHAGGETGEPGDPDTDPYVVEPGPGRGLGEVARDHDGLEGGQGGEGRAGRAGRAGRVGRGAGDADPAAEPSPDTGPLLRPGKEAAA